MKNEILIDILFLLLSREKVSAKYIAEKYGISLRTVYRYISELSIPVPIYNIRGRNGGFAISDTYKLPAAFFTDEEKEHLLSSLNSVKNAVNSEMLTTIIHIIEAVSKKPTEGAPVNFGNLIIDGSAWGSVNSYKETLSLIQNCIEENIVLKIKYRNRNGSETDREIEPHILLLKEGLWYCYAYCLLRKEFRLFKIGRIASAHKSQKNFKRRNISNVQDVFAEWYQTLQTVTVDFDVDPSIKAEVEEWLGVDKVYETRSKKIKASSTLTVGKELIAKILSFGDKLTVVEPIELKKEVLSSLKKTLKLYE